MAGEVKSQGTHLYFVNPTGTPALVKLTCPTGLNGLTSGAKSRIPATCLDETESEVSIPGLEAEQAMSVPFILKTADASHKLLFALRDASARLEWIACLSESATAPTLVTGDIVPPVDRTSFTFAGDISDVAIEVGGNEIVRGTLTIMRGKVTPHWIA